ncbi:hypothetical protein Plhal304r1_c035g0109551 [Plasmopara halstedii]
MHHEQIRASEMRNIEDHSPLKRVAELISCHNESDFTCRPRADFNKLKKKTTKWK